MASRLACAAAWLWPLLTLATLYGEWLLACWLLGRPPQFVHDDPKHIPGNVLHGVTSLFILGFIPAMLAWVGLSGYALVNSKPRLRAMKWAAGGSLAWAMSYLLMQWDPGGVLAWWFD